MSKSKKPTNVDKVLMDPKYNNQQFKKGTKVEMDSEIFVSFLNLNAKNASLLNQFRLTFKEMAEVTGQVITESDAVTEKMVNVYITAVDAGLTENKKTEEDGSTK